MQTDTWLTEEAPYPEQCPLCSRPLKNGSTTCYSCGFTTNPPAGSSVWIDPAVYEYPLLSPEGEPSQDEQQIEERYLGILPQPKRRRNPLTSIPARASAQPTNATPGSAVMPHGVAKGQKNSTAGKAKQWQDTIQPGAESSAPVYTQSPVWQYESPNFQAESSLSALSLMVSETPTQPEVEAGARTTRRLPRIDEIDTVPPQPSRTLVPVTSQTSVTTLSGPGRTSIDSWQAKGSDPVSWTAGAASQSSYAQLISTRGNRKKVRHRIPLNPLDRMRWWLLRPGRIEFVLWLGGTILLVSVTCALLLVTAFSFGWLTPRSVGITSSNISGTSTKTQQVATMVPTTRPTGSQKIKHSSSPVSKGTQNTPVSTTPSSSGGVMPTVTPGNTGPQPTAVAQTPVPSTPAPGKTPTVTPAPGKTPTVTPTPGTTPTVTPTASGSPPVTGSPSIGGTPGATPHVAGGSTLGNDLMQSGIPPVNTRLTSINPLVWLVVACYTLSMMLLGLAGVLHKRHR